jgi:hypothetical protein
VKANPIRDMWEILALAAIVIAAIVTNPARGTAIRTSATIFTRPGSGASGLFHRAESRIHQDGAQGREVAVLTRPPTAAA